MSPKEPSQEILEAGEQLKAVTNAMSSNAAAMMHLEEAIAGKNWQELRFIPEPVGNRYLSALRRAILNACPSREARHS